MGGYHQLPVTPYTPAQQPNPLEMLAGVQSLKNQQAQGQLAQQRIQEGQEAIRQTKVLNDAVAKFTDPKTGQTDHDQVMQYMASNGAGKDLVSYRTSVANLNKEQLATEEQRLKTITQRLGTAAQMASSANDPASWEQVKAHVAKSVSPDIAQQMGDFSPENKQAVLEQGMSAQQNLEYHLKLVADARVAKESAAKLPGEQAKGGQDQLALASQTLGNAQSSLDWQKRMAFLKAKGLGDDVLSQFGTEYSPEAVAAAKRMGVTPAEELKAPFEMQAAKAWLAKPENKGKTLADFNEYNKKLVPEFNFNLQTNTGAGQPAADVAKKFGMTTESFDQTAEKYYQTGQLPALGRGSSGPALQRALMNRAADLHPGASLAENSAEFKANSESLKKLQTSFDQVTAFENTAGKNLDVFLNTAKKVVDSGSPWINKPLRSGMDKGMGDSDQAAFNAARTTALTEIAKVLNSSNASGVLSDSARHEVEELIKPGASLKQIYSAANILKQDMANRHQSYQDQITDIKGRMRGKPAATDAPKPQTSSGGFSWDSLPVHQ